MSNHGFDFWHFTEAHYSFDASTHPYIDHNGLPNCWAIAANKPLAKFCAETTVGELQYIRRLDVFRRNAGSN